MGLSRRAHGLCASLRRRKKTGRSQWELRFHGEECGFNQQNCGWNQDKLDLTSQKCGFFTVTNQNVDDYGFTIDFSLIFCSQLIQLCWSLLMGCCFLTSNLGGSGLMGVQGFSPWNQMLGELLIGWRFVTQIWKIPEEMAWDQLSEKTDEGNGFHRSTTYASVGGQELVRNYAQFPSLKHASEMAIFQKQKGMISAVKLPGRSWLSVIPKKDPLLVFPSWYN